jgi:hypothetical protein
MKNRFTSFLCRLRQSLSITRLLLSWVILGEASRNSFQIESTQEESSTQKCGQTSSKDTKTPTSRCLGTHNELIINAEPKTDRETAFHDEAKLYYFLTLYDLVVAGQPEESMEVFIELNVEMEDYAKAEGIANALRDYRGGVMDDAIGLVEMDLSIDTE